MAKSSVQAITGSLWSSAGLVMPKIRSTKRAQRDRRCGSFYALTGLVLFFAFVMGIYGLSEMTTQEGFLPNLAMSITFLCGFAGTVLSLIGSALLDRDFLRPRRISSRAGTVPAMPDPRHDPA